MALCQTPLVHAVIHRLWLAAPSRALATIQFIRHQAGSLGMIAGLFLVCGSLASEDEVGPVPGRAAICVVLGVLLMLVMVLKADVAAARSTGRQL